MARKHLTQSFVNEQRSPKTGSKLIFWDDDPRGLGIIFGKTKTTYVFQRLVIKDGKRTSHRTVIGEHRTITDAEAVKRHGDAAVEKAKAAGNYQELRAAGWTLEQARARARELKSFHAKTRGGVPTLDDAITSYLEYMEHQKRADRYISQLKTEIQRYCADWVPQRIDRISVADAQDRHRFVTSEYGPVVANRVMRHFRAVVNKRLKRDGLLGKVSNPFLAIDWNREHERRLKTTTRSFAGYVAKVLKQPDDVRVYRLSQLLTGGRPGAVAKLRWENVHLDHAALGFASDKTGPYSVPICDYLVQLLRDFRANPLSSDDLVFPHIANNEHRRKVKGVPPTNDWRKLFKTMAKDEKIDEIDRNTLANHGRRTKTGLVGPDHYEFAELDYYRPLVERVTRRILKEAGLVANAARRPRKAARKR